MSHKEEMVNKGWGLGKETLKFGPLRDGDLFTLKKFIKHCESGCLIDYDGHGYYAYKNKMSNKFITPSHITGRQSTFSIKTGKFGMKNIKKKIDRNFTHVMWFNK